MAKSDLSKAFDKINETLTDLPKAQLEEAAQFTISIISLRTKKGLDADGNVFRPYTPKYAKWRAQKKKLRIAPPDLTVTGHMLGAMIPVVGNNEVSIEFSGTTEIAKAIGNSRLRDFFDVRQDKELEAIAEVVGESLLAEILK